MVTVTLTDTQAAICRKAVERDLEALQARRAKSKRRHHLDQAALDTAVQAIEETLEVLREEDRHVAEQYRQMATDAAQVAELSRAYDAGRSAGRQVAERYTDPTVGKAFGPRLRDDEEPLEEES